MRDGSQPGARASRQNQALHRASTHRKIAPDPCATWTICATTAINRATTAIAIGTPTTSTARVPRRTYKDRGGALRGELQSEGPLRGAGAPEFEMSARASATLIVLRPRLRWSRHATIAGPLPAAAASPLVAATVECLPQVGRFGTLDGLGISRHECQRIRIRSGRNAAPSSPWNGPSRCIAAVGSRSSTRSTPPSCTQRAAEAPGATPVTTSKQRRVRSRRVSRRDGLMASAPGPAQLALLPALAVIVTTR